MNATPFPAVRDLFIYGPEDGGDETDSRITTILSSSEKTLAKLDLLATGREGLAAYGTFFATHSFTNLTTLALEPSYTSDWPDIATHLPSLLHLSLDLRRSSDTETLPATSQDAAAPPPPAAPPSIERLTVNGSVQYSLNGVSHRLSCNTAILKTFLLTIQHPCLAALCHLVLADVHSDELETVDGEALRDWCGEQGIEIDCRGGAVRHKVMKPMPARICELTRPFDVVFSLGCVKSKHSHPFN